MSALAYTMGPGRGDTDLLMARLADALAARGLRTCGTVQINSDCGADRPCDMDVKLLPDGPHIRISQSLGRFGRGCRLDSSALEQAVGLAEARLNDGADIVLVNKFGKQEAEGRGFRPLIAEAVMRGIPVLVGVNATNLPALVEFCGADVPKLPDDVASLVDWCMAALRRAPDAAQ